jgi:hypothetical protein
MTPQIALTAYLVLLTLTGIWRVANTIHTDAQGPRTAGGIVGVLLKHGTVVALLIAGGFYNS